MRKFIGIMMIAGIISLSQLLCQEIEITTPLAGKSFKAGTPLIIEWTYLRSLPLVTSKKATVRFRKRRYLKITLLKNGKKNCIIGDTIPVSRTSFKWKVGECPGNRSVKPTGDKFSIQIQRTDSDKKYLSPGYFDIVRKNHYFRLARISSIDVIFNDCQMDFRLKGTAFGTSQGNRVVRFRSSTTQYDAQVTSWSNTEIYCYLQGNVKLGDMYKIILLNTSTSQGSSNTKSLVLKTRLTQPLQPWIPGQEVAISGCLLGDGPYGRQLLIGGIAADPKSWDCEDIVFPAPQLSPGIYNAVLKDGQTILSNTIQITIH